MSRSGYSDDCGGWALIRWRGAVKQAISGARGQAMLRELVHALDALPEKRLASGSLVTEDGEYCTLGALGRARGMDMAPIDAEDREAVARVLAIAAELSAREAVPVAEKLLDGLWYVHKKCGAGLDDKRLMARIREKKASELVEGANKAAAYYAHGGGAVFAEGMLNVLNKGLQRKFTMGEAA